MLHDMVLVGPLCCQALQGQAQGIYCMQVVGRLDEVDQRLRLLDSKVQASDQTIQDIASKVAGMAVHASA